MDALGKMIYQTEMKPGDVNHEIDLTLIEKGIYFVKFISDKGTATKCIAIE